MILNFYPYYVDLLSKHKKTTTLRLDDQRSNYHVGDAVDITVGWDANRENVIVAKGKITYVEVKTINKLTKNDLDGESPDCREIDAVKYVLSAIYQRVARDDDIVTVIKWKYTT